MLWSDASDVLGPYERGTGPDQEKLRAAGIVELLVERKDGAGDPSAALLLQFHAVAAQPTRLSASCCRVWGRQAHSACNFQQQQARCQECFIDRMRTRSEARDGGSCANLRSGCASAHFHVVLCFLPPALCMTCYSLV